LLFTVRSINLFCIPSLKTLQFSHNSRGDIVKSNAQIDSVKCFSTMNDEEIVEDSRAGDDRALEYLINKYKGFVRAKARTYFLIGADREDIIQEGMIGLYKAIRDFRKDKLSSFRAFAELCITRQIITP